MKGIYLGAFKAEHPNYNIDYQDINGLRDISGDMLDIDLTPYDFIIATPPCNYWSRANFRRDNSEYALATKHLLPYILDKLKEINKPYIVENVRNSTLFKKYGIYDKADFVYEIGRHTYFTNMPFNASNLEQDYDFLAVNKKIDNDLWLTPAGKVVRSNGVVRLKTNSQGGYNVHKVIERWLSVL